LEVIFNQKKLFIRSPIDFILLPNPHKEEIGVLIVEVNLKQLGNFINRENGIATF